MRNSSFILFLGGNYNNYPLRIEQYLPRYLSEYNSIFCFEYPQFLKLFQIILGKIPLFEKVSKNLYIYHSIGLLPFGRTFSLINNINHKINYFIFTRLTNFRKQKSLVITFTPEISFLNINRKIIYYVIDNFTALPYWDNYFQKKEFIFLENHLMKKAYRIITCSNSLYNKYKTAHGKVTYFQIPSNIKQYQNFMYRNKKNIPNDILDIPSPIAGFLGPLYDWRTDISSLIKILKKIPRVLFLFIGDLDIKNRKLYERLMLMKNFKHLDNKIIDVLPAYLYMFDICLIPYQINRYGRYAYPVKIMEYLAMGKPVVTTALPSIKYLSDKGLIYWARNDNEFIKFIKIALKEKKGSVLIKARMAEARKNDWGIRIKEFIRIIEDD